MKRFHPMPFGAEVAPSGTRFRLWAPGARSVSLCLRPGPEREIDVTRADDGWAEVTLADAPPGTRYRWRIDGGLQVPDPASRHQPDGVHGPSRVVDPKAYEWTDGDWMGRPWEEAVLYELNVGTFSPEGTYRGVLARLDTLADLGVTALEIMPVSDFPGRWGWGYDGVQLFAPSRAYGSPEDLKALVDAAHRRGMMVLLDVVYNHFGPEGNYLHVYARDGFFNPGHWTPWGAGINFDGLGSEVVRAFFLHNALYWLEEYHVDGLRLDAVDQIADGSPKHFLYELGEELRARLDPRRQVHLTLENDDNVAHLLERDGTGRPRFYTAQWNDDFHHALHVLVTGEIDGHYGDYRDRPVAWLARSLGQGFAYQGEPSAYRGRPRGEASGHLPPDALVNFLQNHDQAGNRAFGERLASLVPPEAVRAATVLLLLAPPIPMLFMGEEWDCRRPFPFFCDLGRDLADSVRTGRRAGFVHQARFRDDPDALSAIPDPLAEDTFRSACLDWPQLETDDRSRARRQWIKDLLRLRREILVPVFKQGPPRTELSRPVGDTGIEAAWRLADGRRLWLAVNLGPDGTAETVSVPAGETLCAIHGVAPKAGDARLGPWQAMAKLAD